MNLGKKKKLAGRALNVGKDRIIFVAGRLEEIKEAITKRDIKDLVKLGAIKIKDIKGRRRAGEKKRKKGPGKVKKKINLRKREYIIITRKLRNYVGNMREKDKITRDNYKTARKKIKNKEFKSLAQFREYLGGLKQ